MQGRFLLILFLFATYFLSACSEQALPPLPDLQKAIDDYQEKGKNNPKASKFAPEDMQVMQDAQSDLASRMPAPGLRPGSRAPDFSLPNAFGKKISLQQYLDKGPVVLTFYRGAWCPFCNLELHALQQSLPHFKARGATLIAITPQTPDKSQAQIKKDSYEFEVLSDLDDSVIRAYNLYFEVSVELDAVYRKLGLDIAAYNGEGRLGLPVPGTFVIDRDGIIRAVHADVDYKKRMQPAAIVAALDSLK